MIATSPRTPVITSESGFSPIDNEAPLRWMRSVGLVPRDGLGVVRRALFFALLTWLPIFIWAVLAGRLTSSETGESLLQHYGVHVRCLLAIPLLILAESALHKAALRIVPQFLSSGLVGQDQRAGFEEVIRGVRRLRDATLPWVLVLGAAIGWTLTDHPDLRADALSWAVERDGTLGFGGWWVSYVVRPLFIALLLAWLWRLLVVTYWFWRVGKLGLSPVPTHPDRTGGLAFVEKVPGAFAMVTFAVSAVLASRWAHEVLHHDASLHSLRLPAAAFVILWTILLLLPLLALAPALLSARARAIPAYAALVGEQGRLVHRRWILREPVGDAPLLDAPEIGPVADAAAMYDAVKRMRVVPIGKGSIIQILLPMALPLIVVALLRVPLKAVLLTLFKAVL
ncbi:MAG TPA: hypothetical protein VMK32_03615 [Burkholderiaceae bacterium]|nr:hypothetical protein [Burkholderiaceae bacterium]